MGKTTHNKTKTPEYRAWLDMKSRCYNPKNIQYANYGGRGIRVCSRWKNSFETFLLDVGKRPTLDYSLDRIKGNLNYTPFNCRWATIHEQNSNKRNNVRFAYKGETRTLSAWCDVVGLSRNLVYSRLFFLGWTIADALEKPKDISKCR